MVIKKTIFIIIGAIAATICVIITISKASAWSLDSRIDFWEYASFAGALFVIVGIAIECFELGEKWIEKLSKEKTQIKERLFNSEYIKSALSFAEKWDTEIETLGFAIVIAGLAIELGGSVTAFRLSNQRDAITNREAGEARKIAEEAKERTAKLVSSNLEQAIQLEKLKQEKISAYRIISPEGSNFITAKLKSLGHFEVDLRRSIYPSYEGNALGKQLDNLFRNAGCTVTNSFLNRHTEGVIFFWNAATYTNDTLIKIDIMRRLTDELGEEDSSQFIHWESNLPCDLILLIGRRSML